MLNPNSITKNDNEKMRRHKHIIRKKTKVEPVDYFYETNYTASTSTKITMLYNTLKLQCKNCRTSHVDMKMIVKDTYNPTFVILRKLYCISCWCEMMGVGK